MFSALIAALTPSVQLGLSFYASSATLMALLVILSWPRFLGQLFTLAGGLRAAIVLFMLTSLMEGGSKDLAGDVLRVLREGLFFLMLTAFSEFAETSPRPILSHRYFNVIVCLTIFYATLAGLQTIALNRGIYFGIPRTFYIQNADTIPTALDLRYGHQRPGGTFGEPSYFAFVLVSAFVSLAPLATQWRPAKMSLLAICVAGLLTKSLSFILAIPVLGYLTFFRYVDQRQRRQVLVSLGIIVGLALALGAAEIATARLGGARSIHGDTSIYARITGPIIILGNYLIEHPLGSPNSLTAQAVGEFSVNFGFTGREVLNNAALNFFFYYGLMGLPIIMTIFYSVRDGGARIYLLVCMFFNGAFLSVDKFPIICVSLAAYFSARAALGFKPETAAVAARHAPIKRTASTLARTSP